MPNYGIVDLGSNTVRLCIYRVRNDKKKSYANKDFKTLLDHKIMAGLSAHVENGVMTPAGIRRAVDALQDHVRAAEYFNCKRFAVFATAVVRNCSNSSHVVETIDEETGTTIDVLSRWDESHLGFVGATSGNLIEEGTLFDIGGGSTELTCVKQGRGSDNASLDVGSLSSYVRNVKGVFPDPDESRAIEASLHGLLASAPAFDDYRAEEFYGIGGSARSVLKVHAEVLNGGTRPESISLDDIDELLAFFRHEPDRFAHAILRVSPDRIHTIVPGCLLIRTLLADLGGRRFSICKNGVREGYLIERMLGGRSARSMPSRTPPDTVG